ncbi:guanylate cyclase soluble subunit beta-2 [Neoarius graeffei]|uniref:guanylate cyclase soluble subunit beta-2 n=1 Tax=Neoarius graeffei TaxID=443677 RepID=UPI00298C9E88|nr:guanylate cyclase soluble subunit beta-2 [Neoarius graeffei]
MRSSCAAHVLSSRRPLLVHLPKPCFLIVPSQGELELHKAVINAFRKLRKLPDEVGSDSKSDTCFPTFITAVTTPEESVSTTTFCKLALVCKYGFINTCLRTLVVEKFGEEIWEQLRLLAGVQDTFMTYEIYDDVITIRLVQEACKMLDISSEVVLKLFGEYFFSFCKMSGYDTMLRTLGGNLVEFIENLDALHSYLALSYQEMNAPSFRVERTNDGRTLLHYYSDRKGLHHIVPGIIEAVAKDFFGSKVTMNILEQPEEAERTGKKEHVIFLMTQTSEGTQTKEDDGREQREVKEMVTSDIILHSFCPIYPKRLWIDEKAFCNAFPFHIVFDQDLTVKQTGVNIQKFVPGLQQAGIRLDEYFSVVHPEVTFNIYSIKKFINSQFVLKTKREMLPKSFQSQSMLKLRGQMVWMESLHCMVYLCSPKLRSLQELEERGLHLADIAQHDTTRDLILLNQQRLAEIELSNQLERKKEELRILSRHLELEKKKTETLLYAMLPQHVANQLKEGKKVEAGDFKVCTILFSDVVTFTNICAACEPIQIVNMLNAMYSKFDHLTNVHNVYKVETIGDAYMVVGGVPIPKDTHAERVANFALGMRLAAREVNNPITGQPIQIRVGLHTGPVLAGVVGEKMPRYCLFGDTVNTASRMESHGVPDHIHLSPFTYSVLKDKQFEISERGEIQVKGKGLMTTYFLHQNLKLSEEQIMGQGEEATCMYRDDHKEVTQATDDKVKEMEKERKSPSKEQSSSSFTYHSSGDPSPLPATDDTSPFSPATDSPPHDKLNYVLDYSEPIDNGLPSENVNINSRLCMLL